MASTTATEDDEWSTTNNELSTLESSSSSSDDEETEAVAADPFLALLAAGSALTSDISANKTKNEANLSSASRGLLIGKWPPRVGDLFSMEEPDSLLVKMVRALPLAESTMSIHEHRTALIRMLEGRLDRGNALVAREKLISFLIERRMSAQSAATLVALIDDEGGGSHVDARIAIDQLSSWRFRLMPASFCEDIRFLASCVGCSLLLPGEVDIYASHVDKDDYATRLCTYMKGVMVPSHLLPSVLWRSDLSMRLAVLEFWLKRAETQPLIAVNGSASAAGGTQASVDLVQSLKVSSNVKDIDHLTDGRTDTHWESNGNSGSGDHQSHYVEIRLHPRARVSRLRVVVAADDASYMPQRLEVLVGNHSSRITESVKTVIVPRRLTGELNIDLDLSRPYRFMRLRILHCYDDGFDTRLRGLYVDGELLPRESTAEDRKASAIIEYQLNLLFGIISAFPDQTREMFLTSTELLLDQLPPLFVLSNDTSTLVTNGHCDRIRQALQNFASDTGVASVEQIVRGQVCLTRLALLRGSISDLITLADRFSEFDEDSSNGLLRRLQDSLARFDSDLNRLWMKAERRTVELSLVEVERSVADGSADVDSDAMLVVTLRLASEEPFIPVRIKLRGAKTLLAISFIEPDVDRESDSGDWQRFRVQRRVVDSIRLTISVKRKLVAAVHFAVQGFSCRFASLATELNCSHISERLLACAVKIQRATVQLCQADHSMEAPMNTDHLKNTFSLSKRLWEAKRPPAVKRLLLELLSGAIVGCDDSQLAESIVDWLLALLGTEEDADMDETIRRVVSDGCIFLYPDVVKRRKGFLDSLQVENERETSLDRPKAFLFDAFCKHFATGKQDLLDLPSAASIVDGYEPITTLGAINHLIGQFRFLQHRSMSSANTGTRLELINSKLLQVHSWFRQMVANTKVSRSKVAMERVGVVLIGTVVHVFDALSVVLLAPRDEERLIGALSPTVLLMYGAALDFTAVSTTVNFEHQLDDLIRSARSLLQTVKSRAAQSLDTMQVERLAERHGSPQQLGEWSVSLFDDAFAAADFQDNVFDLNGVEYFEIEFNDKCCLPPGNCLVFSASDGTRATMRGCIMGPHWPKTLRMRSENSLHMSFRLSDRKIELTVPDDSNKYGFGFKVRAFRRSDDVSSSSAGTFYLTLTKTLALVASAGVVFGLQQSVEATAVVETDVWRTFFAAGRAHLDASEEQLRRVLNKMAANHEQRAAAGDGMDVDLISLCSARCSRPMVGDGQIKACAYATFAALVWHCSDAAADAKRLLSGEREAEIGRSLVEAYTTAVVLSHRLTACRQQRIKAEEAAAGDGVGLDEAPCVAVGDAIGRARLLVDYCSPALRPVERIAARLVGFVVDSKLDAQTIEEMCILREIRSSLAVSAYEIFEDVLRVEQGDVFKLTFMRSFFHGNRSMMETNREIRQAEEKVWHLLKSNVPSCDNPMDRKEFLLWTTYMVHFAISRDIWQIEHFDGRVLCSLVDRASYQATDEREFLSTEDDEEMVYSTFFEQFYEFAGKALLDPRLVDQAIGASFDDGVSKKLAHMMRSVYGDLLPTVVDRDCRCAGCGQKETFATGCNRCIVCVDVSLCSACLVAGVTPPWPHTSAHPILGATHKCSQCSGLIVGTRWSCLTCRAESNVSVFNLCHGCRHIANYPKECLFALDHDQTHEFEEIRPILLHGPDSICALLAVHLKSLSRLLLTRLVVCGSAPPLLCEALLDRLQQKCPVGGSQLEWFDWLHLCTLLFLSGGCRQQLLSLILDKLLNVSPDARTQIALFGLFGRLAVQCVPMDCDAVIEAQQKNLTLVTSSFAPGLTTVNFLFGFAEQSLAMHSSATSSALIVLLRRLAANNQWRAVIMQYLREKLSSDCDEKHTPFAALVAVGWPLSAFYGAPACFQTQHEERQMGVFLEYNINADRCLIIDDQKRKIYSMTSNRATWPVNDVHVDSALFDQLIEQLPIFLRYRMQAAMLSRADAAWKEFQLNRELFELAAKPTGFDIRASTEVLELAFDALLKIGSKRVNSLLLTPNVDDEVPKSDQDFDGGPSKISGLHISLLCAIRSSVPTDSDTDTCEFIKNSVNHQFSVSGNGQACLDEEIVLKAARYVIQHNCPPADDRRKNADITDRGALQLDGVWELADIPDAVTFLPEPKNADDQSQLTLFEEPPERTLYKEAVAFRGKADKVKPATMVAAELLLNELHRLAKNLDGDEGFSSLRLKLELALSVLYCRKLVALALTKMPLDSLAKKDLPLDVSRLLVLIDAIGMTPELRCHLRQLLDRLPSISLSYSNKVEGKTESAALKALMFGCCYLMDVARPRGPLLVYPSFASTASIPEGAVIGGENQLHTLAQAVDFMRFDMPKTESDKDMPLVSVAQATGPFHRIDESDNTLVYGHQVRVQIIMGEWLKVHGVVTGCFDTGLHVLAKCVKLALPVLNPQDFQETVKKVWMLVVFFTLQSTGDRRLALLALLSELCSLVSDCAEQRSDQTPQVDFGVLGELWRAAHRVLSSVDSQAKFGLKTELARALAQFLADLQTMADRCDRRQQLIEAVFPTDDERLRLIRNIGFGVHAVGAIGAAADLPNVATDCVREINAMGMMTEAQEAALPGDLANESTDLDDTDDYVAGLNGSLTDNTWPW